jgi:hypothetical protein
LRAALPPGLSPEVLAEKHGLSSSTIQRILTLLWLGCEAMHESVAKLVSGSKSQNALVEVVCVGFAALWEVTLQRKVPMNVVEMFRQRDDAHGRAQAAESSLKQERERADALCSRCLSCL